MDPIDKNRTEGVLYRTISGEKVGDDFSPTSKPRNRKNTVYVNAWRSQNDAPNYTYRS
jgi:hypothetical protein